MKFLEYAELDVLSRALNVSSSTLRVNTRVEAYSCKPVAREKKLFKTLESELIQDISHSTSVSPPEQLPGLLNSAFGPLNKRESRKTLWLLIGLLNVAFPDHDFSKVRPEDFRREEGPRAVLASLSAALDALKSPNGQTNFSAYPPASSFNFPPSPVSDPMSLPALNFDADSIPTNPFLRQVLDPIIDLAECEVYSYTPDADSDPHAAETDDETSDSGEDPDAFEKDSDGMNFEMEGVENSESTHRNLNHSPARRGNFAASTSRATAPNWLSRMPGTPMKSIASVFPPGTPTSIADSEDYFGETSSGGLLWSTFNFLFNRKAKRIIFISAWARTPREARGLKPRPRKRNRSRSVVRNSFAAKIKSAQIEQQTAADTADDDEVDELDEDNYSNESTAAALAAAAAMKRSASSGLISVPAPRKRRMTRTAAKAGG